MDSDYGFEAAPADTNVCTTPFRLFGVGLLDFMGMLC
jgi:hypothetical protein